MNTGKFLTHVKQNIIVWLVVIAAVLPKSGLSADAILPIEQSPLVVQVEAAPRVMLAMSRDHQLYIKAYTDYSDLDNDGILDTTYNDSIDYYGYFDNNKCYTYASDLFQPSALATGDYSHQCKSQWSGNFLNWATMTRMDVIRKVLYGGYRYQDDSETVLERTLIPYDVHAFAKVFKTATAKEMQQYTPYAQETISICNSTQVDVRKKALSKDIDTKSYPPLMYIAKGSWPRWASAKNIQCQWSGGTLPSVADNLFYSEKEDGLNVRVKVCVDGLEESNCKSYTDTNKRITKKPTGLLQKYWDSEKPIVFGLVTGSWGNNKSGGVLRAIPPFYAPGNPSPGEQEVDSSNGRFRLVNQANGGIIATLDRFRISHYQFDKKDSKNQYTDCDTGKLSFDNGECVDWGNPLSEIYLETLRYLAGRGGPEQPGPLFATDDSPYVPAKIYPNIDTSIPLDKKTWNDPIDEGNWCARSSIVAISTGLNSFDTDELDNDLTTWDGTSANKVVSTNANAVAETNAVGTLEGISGNYLIGSSTSGTGTGSDNDKQCTGKTLSSLSAAQGICPEIPSQEGGYHIAGLAYYARTHDFRPEYKVEGYNEVFFSGVQSINTYSVALAENLARFEIPVGSGTITILPACLANSEQDATSTDTGWRPCSMTDLIVESLTYVKDADGNYVTDKNGKKQVSGGTFTITWEDSTWGSNYDMDGIERLKFCVGSACGSSVTSDHIKITASVIQAESDAAMQFGYTITGSTEVGIKLPILRPGNKNFNVGGETPIGVTAETTTEYIKGSSSAKLLENPLWYAAKYGGFDTIDETKAETPALQSWDEDENGIPDAFFKATNPTLLENALDGILSNISSKSASSASAAANSTRLDTTSALYQAKFIPARWTGQLLAFQINSANGNLDETPAWDAGEKVTTQGFSGRSIFSYNEFGKNGIIFDYDNLSDAQKLSLDETNKKINSAYNSLSDTKKQALLDAQINYVKGEQVNEKPNGPLRKRLGPDGLMGDIINSDPEFINSLSQGYDSLPEEEGRDYLNYIISPAYRNRSPMVAVGANDGMLHVFNASVGIKDTDGKDTGGNELLAYVPSTILSKLPALTLPTYITQGNHKYFVDGSPNSGDAYIDADGDGTREWRKVLVGTMGAGGKGIFALDVTFLNPKDYTKPESSFSASRVLWEINDGTAPNAADLSCDETGTPNCYGFKNYLGVTMGQASIVRMANGKFAAVFGNGYNSIKQTAVLYIVDIDTGELIRSITTGVGNDTSLSTINGLATPLTVDVNGDHIVDAIYAGDYRGNLWKFDVSDSSEVKWDVAGTTSGSEPLPFFITKSTPFSIPDPYAEPPYSSDIVTPEIPQPITAKPEFDKHPKGGIMLYFGTGKYFLSQDNAVSIYADPVETFYGVWDECVNYAMSKTDSCPKATTIEKSALAEQSIDYQDVLAGFNVRVTSKNEVDYSTVKGWFMDLYRKGSGTITGERVVSQPIIRDRRIIFSTIVPDQGACVYGGTSWLMLLDALTGQRLDANAFDLTGSGFVDKVMIKVGGVDTAFSMSGVQSTVGQIDTPALIETDGTTDELVGSGSSGKTEKYKISKLLGGRQSWLQLR